MKEIKFRGKTFGGKWVEGYYVVEKSTGKHKITDGLLDINEVKAETIGMGTGVLDKDGTEIFEGDVVQNGEGGYFYIVYWWSEDAAFRGKQVGSSSTIGLNYWRKELRIVGNIHDNPELLQYKPAPPKRRDRHTLLPGEFRIKGTCSNGCMCQPDVIYVARWLTKADAQREVRQAQEKVRCINEELKDAMQQVFEQRLSVKEGDIIITKAGTKYFYERFIIDSWGNIFVLCHPAKNDGTASKAIRHIFYGEFIACI